MAITDRFVLPAGGVLAPVSELSETIRRDIGSQGGDFVLSRPGSRVQAKVIDADSADLVKEFREPSTIAQAVARYSRGKSAEPERLLEEALPMLQSLIVGGLLVRAGSDEASEIRPTLEPQQRVGEWAVLRCLQAMEDTEIFHVRDSNGRFGALKIARAPHALLRRSIDHEATVLAELDGSGTPKLLESAEWESRSYLVTEWIGGVDAHSVCAELRSRGDATSYHELRDVTGAILRAYARLHGQGILHGDVHPRNVLIDRYGAIKIIDLGLASRISDVITESATRGGIGFFFEPEFARAALRDGRAAPLTAAGEQYALGALLYLLIAGSHYLDFSLEKTEMFRLIAEAPMVPFERRGVRPWPSVERLLVKALKKDPADRFSSVSEFAERWFEAAMPQATAAVSAAATKNLETSDKFVELCAIGGSLISGDAFAAPTTSVNYGSSGLAYALYRIACARDDGECFALSDLWSARAAREIEDDAAFYSKNLDVDPEAIGRTSLYHGRAGVFLVQALIARARGDIVTQFGATQAFVETCRQPDTVLDLTLGRAGALLGCTFLLDAVNAISGSVDIDAKKRELCHLGDDISAELWATLEGYAPIGECRELTALGVAHGWAGLLYATLCWCAAAIRPPSDALSRRLRELACFAEPVGRGLQWKYEVGGTHSNPYMPGWCNGSAGYVFLWTQAYGLTGDRVYLELAEGAAWNVWEAPNPNPSLCCGSAGQAYALLNFYSHSHESTWLRRALDLGESAFRAAKSPHESNAVIETEWRLQSLYKGYAGVAVLCEDLARPSEARMPLFEREL